MSVETLPHSPRDLEDLPLGISVGHALLAIVLLVVAVPVWIVARLCGRR